MGRSETEEKEKRRNPEQEGSHDKGTREDCVVVVVTALGCLVS